MLKRELNFSGPSPILYLVATPIGNREEFSTRAIKTLQEVDFIGCEDTRNSGQLFASFNIDKPLISCHEHNEEEAANKIVALLKEGKKVAYVSDAGYPTISDPGGRLVKRALEEGIKVSVINGPSASVCALAASGLDTSHYYFEGFLPSKPSERDSELKELSTRKETIVFYESPHRIDKTLKAMKEILGEDRNAVIARELTKLHEEFIRGSLGELASIDASTLIGEMVIVVEGAKSLQKSLSEEEIVSQLLTLLKSMKPKDAIATLAENNKINKNKVYSLYLEKIKEK